jgi:ATP/maltotriose-dependent transcriptional regulator MalT
MELSETALRTAETTSNLDVRALVFMARAAALASHDPARSHRWVLHALEEATRAGNEHLVWQAYTNLAEIALTTGNSEEALYWCREVLRRDLLSKPIIRAYIVDIMAGALLLKGDLPQARTALREALRLVVNTSHFVAVEALLFFAALAAASGDLRAAAILLGRHDVMLQTLGSVRVDSSVRIYDQFLADLPDRLGASVYAAYRAQGEALTWQQVIDWLLHDHVPLSENPAAIPSWGTG